MDSRLSGIAPERRKTARRDEPREGRRIHLDETGDQPTKGDPVDLDAASPELKRNEFGKWEQDIRLSLGTITRCRTSRFPQHSVPRSGNLARVIGTPLPFATLSPSFRATRRPSCLERTPTVTDNADQPLLAPGTDVHAIDVPETDDPVVLRELLRQAREHLRIRESIERMLSENTARTEALLLEARARAAPAIDREALAGALADLRASLQAALAAVDRLEAATGDGAGSPETAPQLNDAPTPRSVTSEGEPGTVEVLVHEIHAPALARSLQRYLAELEGVDNAEVRELAEGILRITVTGTAALDGDSLAGWEPQRGRTILTARPDVLEIELAPANP